MLDTILFDLDGTLVPFTQEDFIAAYFRALVGRVAPMGYDGERVVEALWRGTAAMLQNDGSRLNRDVFWDVFAAKLGEEARSLEGIMDRFYTEEFDAVSATLRQRRELGGMMASLRERGYTLVLATNPIFPAVAVATRLRWVGLTPGDFHYVTTYGNSVHSKPNPAYYEDILALLGKEAGQCLMIGNNPSDDGAARCAGIDVRIVTDYLENERELPLEDFPCCSFRELEAFLAGLPRLG